ncbi:MAG: hypothetical protein Q8R92_05465 [Deltaproteobacteria bacterium]|nr:hypothetical protein [Deltaproteobacteria bacterium]
MMRRSLMWHALVPRLIPGSPLALLFVTLVAFGPGGCTSSESGPRPPAPKPATEIFESFDSDAFIEEETIAVTVEPFAPVAPAPVPGGYEAPGVAPALTAPPLVPAAPTPDETERSRGSIPLSSPGALPAGVAPPQPSNVQ